MPKKQKHPCAYPGCPNLTDKRFCERHGVFNREHARQTDKIYNSRWRKISHRYLRSHPFCVECLKQGRYTKATVTDHIVPHRGNPKLMWDEHNFQALCKRCHDNKTLKHDIRPVYSYDDFKNQ